MTGKNIPEEIDYEDIPFVFAVSIGYEPSLEEVSIIAATLAALYPHQTLRPWSTESKVAAVSNGIDS